MRRASLSLIPPTMFRHFAAVTLALTTALAMFADGETREARASQIAGPKPVAKHEPARFAIPPDTRIEAPLPTGWYDGGVDATFGLPMQRLFARASGSIELLEADEGVEATEDQAEESRTLTVADREQLLRQLRENRSAGSDPIEAF